MLRLPAFFGLTLLLIANGAAPSPAGDMLAGPIPAHVERVIDGDTIAVRAKVWIGEEINVLVRIDRIDAPEMEKGCPASRAIAEDAKALVAETIEGRDVTLHHIRGDKYFGRVIADIEVPGAGDLAATLLASGLARPYAGGKRCGWCGEAIACRVSPARASRNDTPAVPADDQQGQL